MVQSFILYYIDLYFSLITIITSKIHLKLHNCCESTNYRLKIASKYMIFQYEFRIFPNLIGFETLNGNGKFS